MKQLPANGLASMLLRQGIKIVFAIGAWNNSEDELNSDGQRSVVSQVQFISEIQS
jgi:hypothetical protein